MGKKEKNASKGATATNKRGSCSSKQSSSRLDLEQPEVDEKYTKTKGKSSSNNNNHRSETKKNKSTKRKNVGSTNHNSNKSDDELRHAIEADGTKSVLEMAADGNCLFRSLSDQLYNDFGDHHVDVRDDVVDYMEQHKDDFVVFLVLDDKDCNDEDATDFESYCNDMRNDGTWGGNLELVAASKFYRRNITVYSSNLAAFTIHHDNTKGSSGPDLELSYHDNDHYNSVRLSKPTTKPIKFPTNTSSDASYTEPTRTRTIQDIDKHHHQQDDEMSTTDTDSSGQSGKTAVSTTTTTSDYTATTAETVDSTTTTVSSSSSSAQSSATTSTLYSSSSIASSTGKTEISGRNKALLNDRKALCTCSSGLRYQKCCLKKEKRRDKASGISRIKIMRGYQKVNDFDEFDDDGKNRSDGDDNDQKSKNSIQSERSKNRPLTSKTRRSRTVDDKIRSLDNGNDDVDEEFVSKGQFRVLKI